MTWREVDMGPDDRFRFREREPDRPMGNRYTLEYWHAGRREWREAHSPSSRDWFAIGIQAGLDMAREGVQPDLFGGQE